MRIPGFTAEASLAKTTRRYVLAARAAIAGRVVPQGLWVNPASHHLIYCDDVVGCVDLGYVGPRTLM
jgi:hypothetical protein